MADATPVTGGPAPVAPALAGVQQNTNDQQQQVLAAMARYGQGGLDAYNQAQQQLTAQRQSVLDSVAKAQGLGSDAASLIQAKAQASMAPAQTNLTQGQASLQGDLARGNDMYTRYAGEANAAIPVLQQNLQNQMSVRDQALQLAQQQIDAQKAADAAKAANDQKIAALNLAQQQAQTQAAQAARDAALAKAATPKPPTVKALQGAATQAQNQHLPSYDAGNILNAYLPTTDIAAGIGAQTGADQNTLNELYAPGTVASLNSAQAKLAPAPPDVTWLTKNVPGVNQQMAQQYVNDPEWQSYQKFTDALMSGAFQTDANGLITNANNAPAAYVGKTPRQALETYVQSLPGYAHQKTAAIQYYGGALDQMNKK